MLVTIPNVLNQNELLLCQRELATAKWAEGGKTAGAQSRHVKHNQQLPEQSSVAQSLAKVVTRALLRNETFLSASVPLQIFPPLFNRYQIGQSFGSHVDNAIRSSEKYSMRIRTDLSGTLFLSDINSYAGGELVVEDAYSKQQIKLPGGSLVLYPSTSLHHVAEVTSGERLAAVFWLQSMVRSTFERSQLFALDQAIQALAARHSMNDPVCLQLSNIYHNLVRNWAEL